MSALRRLALFGSAGGSRRSRAVRDGLPESIFGQTTSGETSQSVKARIVIGADGANSALARREVPGAQRGQFVFAYHEVIASPRDGTGRVDGRCEIHYRGALSPDFYGWIFPHGETMSVGSGIRPEGVLAESIGSGSAGAYRSFRRIDDPAGRRANPAEASAPLGQWPRRRSGWRRRGRRRARLRRGHLLRDARRPAGCGSGRGGAQTT